MTIVRTVLGDVAPESLGVCYSHEHLIIDAGFVTEAFPDFLLDSVDRAVDEVTEFRDAGGRTLVDSMPAACGRNAAKLAEVSRRTGVHILCPTGVHLRKYYPPDHFFPALDEALPMLAGYVRQAAQQTNQFADSLRDKKADELLSTAVNWSRQQPLLTLAGAAVLGFALARIAKSGVATATPDGEKALDLLTGDSDAR